jgi:hypothetical protein
MRTIALIGALGWAMGVAAPTARATSLASFDEGGAEEAFFFQPQTWLDDESGPAAGLSADGSVREEFVARLVAPIEADPLTAPLIRKALKLSGKKSMSGIVKACAWKWGKENWTQGQTTSSWSTQTVLPYATDMTEARKPERVAYFKRAVQEFVAAFPNATYFIRADHVGYAILIASMSDRICLAPNLPPSMARTVLVHELTHFTYPGGANRIEVQDVHDADEFALFKFSAPGGEADAFRAGFSASARWAGNTREIPVEARALFDGSGNYLGKTTPLVSAKGRIIGRNEDPVLRKYVLDTLGYGAAFRKSYADLLDFFRGIYLGLIEGVRAQSAWAGGRTEVQARIDEQVAELREIVAEIDLKKKLPIGPAGAP